MSMIHLTQKRIKIHHASFIRPFKKLLFKDKKTKKYQKQKLAFKGSFFRMIKIDWRLTC
jgi:hypothetical protein